MTSQMVLTAVVSIVAALASGGAVQAWLSYRQSKRRDASPEHRTEAAMAGSTQAVLTMSDALKAANDRAEQAEEDVKELRAEIGQMKAEHRQEMDSLRSEHTREITDLRRAFTKEINDLKQQRRDDRNEGKS